MQSAGFGRKFLDGLFLEVPLSRNVGPDGEMIQRIFLFIPSCLILQKFIVLQDVFIYLQVPRLCIVGNAKSHSIQSQFKI